MWVGSLGQEDPLKNEVATPSSILAWEILFTGELGQLESMGLQNSDTTKPANQPSRHKKSVSQNLI